VADRHRAARAAQAPAAPKVPDDAELVEAAVAAAEDIIFSTYRRSEIRDLDIGVQLVEDRLEIDIYLDVPDGGETAERVADDAALTAQSAVDERLED